MESGNTLMTTIQGWIETIKSNVQGLFSQFEFSLDKLLEFGIAGAFGGLFGFLTKRFGKQTVIIVLALAVVFYGLDYFHVLSVDWSKIKEVFGIVPSQTFDGAVQEYVQLIKANAISFIVAVIGFIVGYKIG